MVWYMVQNIFWVESGGYIYIYMYIVRCEAQRFKHEE